MKKPIAPPIRDETLVARVRALLSRHSDVKEKKMFGSLAFLVRGRLCVSARPERIMVRIDPADHAAALRLPGVRPVVMKWREYPGYVYVDATSLKTKRALQRWITRALEHHQTKYGSA